MAKLILITNPLTNDKIEFNAKERTILELMLRFVSEQPNFANYLFNNHHSVRLNRQPLAQGEICTTSLKEHDSVLIYPNIHEPISIMAVITAAANAAGAAAGITSTALVGGSAVSAGAVAGAGVATSLTGAVLTTGMSNAILAASYVGAAIGTLAPMAALMGAMTLFSSNKPSMGGSDGGLGAASPTYGWEVQQMANEGIPVPVGYGRFKTGGNIISTSTQSKVTFQYEWVGAGEIDMQGSSIPNLIAVPLCPSSLPIIGIIPYFNMGMIGLWPPVRGFAVDLDPSIWLYTMFYIRLWSWGDLKRLIANIIHLIEEENPIDFGDMSNHAGVIQRFLQAFSRHSMIHILNHPTKWGGGTLIDKIKSLIGRADADSEDIHNTIEEQMALVDIQQDVDIDTAIASTKASMMSTDSGESEYSSRYIGNSPLDYDYSSTHLELIGDRFKTWWNALFDSSTYKKRFTLVPLIAPGLTGGTAAHIFDSYANTEDNMGCYVVGVIAWTPEMITSLINLELPVPKWYMSNMNFLTWMAGQLIIGNSSWAFPKRSPSEEQILHQLTALGEGEYCGIEKITLNKTPINAIPGTDFVFFKGGNTQKLSGDDARFVDAVRWYQKAGIEKSVNDELKEIGDASNFNSVAECNNVEIKIDFTAYHTNKKGKIKDLGDYPMKFAILTGLQENITIEENNLSDINALFTDYLYNRKLMCRVYEYNGGTTSLCRKVYYAFELLAWITKVIEWILFYSVDSPYSSESENAGEMAAKLNIAFDRDRYETEARYRFNIRQTMADQQNYWTVDSILREFNVGDFFLPGDTPTTKYKRVSGIASFCNMMGIELNESRYNDPDEVTYKSDVTDLIRDGMNALFTGVGKKLSVKVVRLTSIDDDLHPTYVDNMIVKSYTEVSYTSYDYANTAMGALAIRATNEFNSSPPEVLYNVKARKVRAPKLYLDGTETRVFREFAWFDEDIGAYRSTRHGGQICEERLSEWGYEFNDNPIWCLYDFLINRRFGLGNYINQSDTDIFQFIEMAHYCDQMVPDGINRIASDIAEAEINDQDPDLFKMNMSRYVKEYDSDFNPSEFGKDVGDFRQVDPLTTWADEWWDFKRELTGDAIFSKRSDGGWTKAVIQLCNRPTGVIGFRNCEFLLRSAYPNGDSHYWTNDEPTGGYSTNYYQLGQKRFRLDINIDERSSAPDIIKTICDTFRCAPIWMNGTVFPIIDRWEHPVAVIGMGNIIKDSFSLSYTSLSKTPNVLECQFSNEELDFDKDTRVKIASNVDLAYSSEITKTIRRESTKLIGITRPSQLERELTYRLNTYQERIRVISFQMGIEHLNFHAGQTIALTHDILTLGSYSGRVVDYNSGASTVYLDQDVTKPGAESWKMQITRIVQDEIDTDKYYEMVGEFSVDSVSGSSVRLLGLNGFEPGPFDNYAIGEVNRVTENYKLLSVQPKGVGEAEVTAVNWGRDIASGGVTVNAVFGQLRPVAPWRTDIEQQYVTYDDCLLDTRNNRVIDSLIDYGPNELADLSLTELPGEVGIRVEITKPTNWAINGYDHAVISLAVGDDVFEQVAEIKSPGTIARITKAMGATLGVVNKVQARAVYTSGTMSEAREESITVSGVTTDGFKPPAPQNIRLSEWCKRHPLQFNNAQAREIGTDFIELVWDRVNARNLFGKNSWLINPKDRYVKEYEITAYRSMSSGAYVSGALYSGALWEVLPSGGSVHYVSSTENRFKIKVDEMAAVSGGSEYSVTSYPYYKFEVRSVTDDMFASDPSTICCSYPAPDEPWGTWHFRIPGVDMVFVRWHYPKWWASVDHYEVNLTYRSRYGCVGNPYIGQEILSGQTVPGPITTDGNIPMLFHFFNGNNIHMVQSGTAGSRTLNDVRFDLDHLPFIIQTDVDVIDKFGRSSRYTVGELEDVPGAGGGGVSGGVDNIAPVWINPNLQVVSIIPYRYFFTRFCKARVSFSHAYDVDSPGKVHYEVSHREIGTEGWHDNVFYDALVSSGGTCTCILPLLEPNKNFEWKARALDRFQNPTGWAYGSNFFTTPDNTPPSGAVLNGGSFITCCEAEKIGVSSTIYVAVASGSLSADVEKIEVQYKINAGDWILHKSDTFRCLDCLNKPDNNPPSPDGINLYLPVKHLLPGVTYKFRAKAIDYANNHSTNWSNEVTFTAKTVEIPTMVVTSASMIPLWEGFFKKTHYRVNVEIQAPTIGFDYAHKFEFLFESVRPTRVGSKLFGTHSIFRDGPISDTNKADFYFDIPPAWGATKTVTGWTVRVRTWCNGVPGNNWSNTLPLSYAEPDTETDIESLPSDYPKWNCAPGRWREIFVQCAPDSWDFPNNFTHFSIHARVKDASDWEPDTGPGDLAIISKDRVGFAIGREQAISGVMCFIPLFPQWGAAGGRHWLPNPSFESEGNNGEPEWGKLEIKVVPHIWHYDSVAGTSSIKAIKDVIPSWSYRSRGNQAAMADPIDDMLNNIIIPVRAISAFGGDVLFAPSARLASPLLAIDVLGAMAISWEYGDAAPFSAGDIVAVCHSDNGFTDISGNAQYEIIKINDNGIGIKAFYTYHVTRGYGSTSKMFHSIGTGAIKIGKANSIYRYTWMDASEDCMKIIKSVDSGGMLNQEAEATLGSNTECLSVTAGKIQTQKNVQTAGGVIMYSGGIQGYGLSGATMTKKFDLSATTGILTCANANINTPVVGGGFGPGSDVSIVGWSNSIVFTAPLANAVQWANGGQIRIPGIPSPGYYTIGAGSKTSMTANVTYYIYFDINTPTTLQCTDVPQNAVGTGKILVCVARAGTTKATFQVMGGGGGVTTFINADNMAANCITANQIAANTITSTQIQAGSITADRLSFTVPSGGSVSGGLTPEQIAKLNSLPTAPFTPVTVELFAGNGYLNITGGGICLQNGGRIFTYGHEYFGGTNAGFMMGYQGFQHTPGGAYHYAYYLDIGNGTKSLRWDGYLGELYVNGVQIGGSNYVGDGSSIILNQGADITLQPDTMGYNPACLYFGSSFEMGTDGSSVWLIPRWGTGAGGSLLIGADPLNWDSIGISANNVYIGKTGGNLGFFGKYPASGRYGPINDATTGTVVSTLNVLLQALRAYGLIAT